jgi:CIC family chloride channel protein
VIRKGVSAWLKINALALLVGIVGGLGSVVFRQMIQFFHYIFFDLILPRITFMVGGYNIGYILLPAIGALIVGPIVFKVAPETKGHGVPEVIEAVALNNGVIRTRVAAVKIIVSSLTIGSGGSVGREGPIAQIGSSFGSALAQWFHLDESYQKLLVVCGLSSGISGTFMAPLGGALFGIEVIYGGIAPYDVIPVFLASVVGFFVTGEVFGLSPAFAMPTYRYTNLLELAYFVPIGLLFGLMSIVWTRGLYIFEDFFDDLGIPEWVKPSIGGLLTGILGMFFVSYGIFGTGYEGLEMAIAGNLPFKMLIILGIVKLVATSLTVGSGSSGGVFAPSLYIGGMLGGALGLLIVGLPFAASEPFVYSLIGMAALFTGAARAPLTCIVMLPEMSGNYYLFPPLMLACASSYFISMLLMRDSIYTIKLKRRGVNVDKPISPLHLVHVSDVMTPLSDVVSVKPDTPLSVVSFIMWETEHTAFPVIDEGRYYGMLSFEMMAHIPEEMRETLKAKEAATMEHPLVRIDDNIYSVMEKISNDEFEILPVMDKDGKVLGLISDSDVLQAFSLGEKKMNLFN